MKNILYSPLTFIENRPQYFRKNNIISSHSKINLSLMLKFFVKALIINLVYIPILGMAQALTTPLTLDTAIRTGVLSNGMHYFIQRNSKPENRVELRIALKAGSLQEDDNQQGLAHFCEHMCFNGTRNFKKSELVDYLESIGTKFGAHLNAYTSFDETVYMLQVPTDKPEILQKGLLVLEDWASGVSFDPAEIDKERGVVMEEWRLGQGAENRMQQKTFPVIFHKSRYAERLPIGKPEIIQKCEFSTLKKFYTDWYRPELMAIIIVGEIDVEQMEKEIKSRFNKLSNAANTRKREEYIVPAHDSMLVTTATDKEATYSAVTFLHKYPPHTQKNIGDLKRNFVQSLITDMLSERMEEAKQKPTSPFSYAFSYWGSYVKGTDGFQQTLVASSDQNISPCITEMFTELERVHQHGFTEGELVRAKSRMLKELENKFKEKDKTPSSTFARVMINDFLSDEITPSLSEKYKLATQLFPGITLAEINQSSKVLFNQENNTVIEITAPEKEGVKLPTAAEIRNIYVKVKKQKINPYSEVVATQSILPQEPIAGKIEAEKNYPGSDIKIWKLSNGAVVISKKTDFQKDNILFKAQSNGGASLYGDSDHLNAIICGDLVSQMGAGQLNEIDLNKYLSGKTVDLTADIGELNETLNGSFAKDDGETFFQLLHARMRYPRKDQTSFDAQIKMFKGFLENRSGSPEAAFADTVQVTMAQYNPRVQPITVERLKEINLNRAYDIYKERFNNPGEFTFVFVGNFDEPILRQWVEKYIGSLPGEPSSENWKDNGIRTPGGRITKSVIAGTEPKSQVQLIFTGPFEYNRKNRNDLTCLTRLASTKLREELREEKGGTYGVGVQPKTEKFPMGKYSITISFGCSPENVDTLTKSALKVLHQLGIKAPSEMDMTKIKETYRREIETALKENNFWLSVITNSYMYGEDITEVQQLDGYLMDLKAEKLQELALKYFNFNQYADFYLVPNMKLK